MSTFDKTYKKILQDIVDNGYSYEDPNRKGVFRKELLSATIRHELKDGFPALSLKHLPFQSVITELLWFLRGDTNIKYLIDNGCNIWNEDAYNYFSKKCGEIGCLEYYFDQFIENIKYNSEGSVYIKNYKLGDLGPVYGHQWVKWGSNNKEISLIQGINQISNLIKNLKEQPLATNHIVNSWNVGDLQDMALPPCHYGFQIVVRPLSDNERLNLFYKKGYTSGDTVSYSDEDFEIAYSSENISKYGFELHFKMRSVDTFLGLPFNVASYSTLALLLEKITGHKALAVQGDLKNVHLYDNQFEAANELLGRDENQHPNCSLKISDNALEYIRKFNGADYNNLDNLINALKPEDFTLEGYSSFPAIKVPMLTYTK